MDTDTRGSHPHPPHMRETALRLAERCRYACVPVSQACVVLARCNGHTMFMAWTPGMNRWTPDIHPGNEQDYLFADSEAAERTLRLFHDCYGVRDGLRGIEDPRIFFLLTLLEHPQPVEVEGNPGDPNYVRDEEEI